MQKSIFLLLVGCAAITNAVETSSLRTKLKGLAQLSAQGAGHNDTAPASGLADECDLEAPELGDLSGDLLDWCPDTFGADRANLGSALSTSALQSVNFNEQQTVSSIPDTQQNTTVQALCNSCNAAAHEESSEASRIRTFDISGQICVEENIRFCELGSARERAQGASEKLGVCVLSNTGSDEEVNLGTLEACNGDGISYTAPDN